MPLQLPVALEGADRVPTLAMDVLQQPLRGVPTVELDVNGPVRRQQRLEGFEHGAGQRILAAKSQTPLGGAVTVESAYRLGTQVQA